MNIIFSDDDSLQHVIIGWIEVAGASVQSSSESFRTSLQELITVRAQHGFSPNSLKQAVREMLRRGGFKPAGRQKPASEYLLQAARAGDFPFINAPVDCNNYFSLKTGFPISILDSRITGETVIVKIAQSGESYIFNAGGQAMDLEGLLCICNSDGLPLGNPVKDSMLAKLKETSTDFAGFIYVPQVLHNDKEVTELSGEFAELVQKECGGVIKGFGAERRK